MKKLIVLLFLLALFLGGFLLWWGHGTAPADKSNTTKYPFVINKYTGVREIANQLKQQGLINDPIVFFLLVKQQGLAQKIQAGSFELSPSQSAQEIAQTLTVGRAEEIKVTIPDGKRAEEVAAILAQKLPKYNDSWVETLKANEGYLFPETYYFDKDTTIETVMTEFVNTFKDRMAQVQNHTNLSPAQLVILASLLEHESRLAQDRPLVSSVLQNRLKLGMPLQLDSTIQYLLGYSDTEKTWWRRNFTYDDLKIDSPYNTYVVAGLPPTPICSPSLDFLQAAANPANTDYLYFMADKNGDIHYAKTFAQHNANITKYGLLQ